MTIENIQHAFDLGLGAGLVVVGIGFFILSVWPYLVKRDTEERERRALHKKSEIEQQGIIANAAVAGANHLKPPIRVQIIGRNDTG